jgi:hypothetical protein
LMRTAVARAAIAAAEARTSSGRVAAGTPPRLRRRLRPG